MKNVKKIQTQAITQPGSIYHHLLWTITPRPVWIIGTCNKDNTPNLSTITCVSNNPGPPENIIVSMTAKRTIANILRTGEFSVNLANVEMAPLADYVGSISGEDGAKDNLPYDFTWGNNARVPILDSPCALECKVSHTHVIGAFHTFFGEALNLHIDATLNPPTSSQEDLFKWFHALDIHKIDPLVYHSIRKYFRVGEKV